MHQPNNDSSSSFNLEFTFFGDVFEKIIEWNPPIRYVYSAQKDGFPIKNYLGHFEIYKVRRDKGTLKWNMHYSHIEGQHYKKIIPVILPPIIEESINLLSPMVSGVSSKMIVHN